MSCREWNIDGVSTLHNYFISCPPNALQGQYTIAGNTTVHDPKNTEEKDLYCGNVQRFLVFWLAVTPKAWDKKITFFNVLKEKHRTKYLL